MVNSLIGGAVDYLVRHGADKDDLTIVRVPGAFEMPIVAKKLAESKKYDGIVAVGAVIRGATPHFDLSLPKQQKGLPMFRSNTAFLSVSVY